jgi:hypothetical protein
MALAVIILLLWSALLQAATPADSAVFGVFKQAETGLAHFAVLQRAGLTKENVFSSLIRNRFNPLASGPRIRSG